ncbi:MAG TPA: 3-phosphoglycerate dehydrogenase, partial [Steroidobacteraceae bacterium]
MSFHILTLNQISARGLARFPADRYQVGADISRPDAILVRSAELHGSSIAPSVRAIGRAGAGVNNIPVDDMS